MIQADIEATTNASKKNTSSTSAGELTPVSCEYVGADEVLVSLKTKAGGLVTYTMKTAMLVQSINLSVALINNCTGQVFRDLGVF